MVRRPVGVLVALVSSLLVACGGGGGGSNPAPTGGTGVVSSPSASPGSPSPHPSPSLSVAPSPSPSAGTGTLSATMVDYVSAAPVSGLTVIVGPTPNPATCSEAQTQSTNTCGVVASTTATTTTSANGTFSVTGLAPGTYMLMVGPTNGSYATLHRTVTITAGTATALGTIQLTALSSTVQAWLADVNYQRASVATPQSFANLVVDEYLQEQANLWAANVAAGTTAYSDAAVAPYEAAYNADPGAMYATGDFYHNIAIVPTGDTQEQADQGYMSEQTAANACGPYGGNWQTCAANGDPGPHYVDIAETADVWVGLGSTTALYSPSPSSGSPSCIFFVGNTAGPLPASVRRK